MPTIPIILNVKTPLATTSEAFGFVFQTTPLPPRKDSNHDLLYLRGARV